MSLHFRYAVPDYASSRHFYSYFSCVRILGVNLVANFCSVYGVFILGVISDVNFGFEIGMTNCGEVFGCIFLLVFCASNVRI